MQSRKHICDFINSPLLSFESKYQLLSSTKFSETFCHPTKHSKPTLDNHKTSKQDAYQVSPFPISSSVITVLSLELHCKPDPFSSECKLTLHTRVRTLTGKEIELDIENDYKVDIHAQHGPHRPERELTL